MTASLIGNTIQLDNGKLIDLGIAKVVRAHQSDPNLCYIDDRLVDLGASYVSMVPAFLNVIGS